MQTTSIQKESDIAPIQRYIPLVQKPCCCAITCLQMILYRNIGKLYDTQELAIFFGVKVDPEYQKSFNVELSTLNSYNNDEGISTLDSISRLNEFFTQHGLALNAKWYRSSSIPKLSEFIIDHIAEWHDLWVEYHTDEIYPETPFGSIHDNLIESINTKTGEVTLVDPEYDHPPRKTTTLKKLERSISKAFWRETGIVVISQTTEIAR